MGAKSSVNSSIVVPGLDKALKRISNSVELSAKDLPIPEMSNQEIARLPEFVTRGDMLKLELFKAKSALNEMIVSKSTRVSSHLKLKEKELMLSKSWVFTGIIKSSPVDTVMLETEKTTGGWLYKLMQKKRQTGKKSVDFMLSDELKVDISGEIVCIIEQYGVRWA